MGAAQDDILHVPVPIGAEEVLQVGVQGLVLKVPLLDALGQARTGEGDHVGQVAEGRCQLLVLVLPDGQGCGHDQHGRAAAALGGGLHRRLDADDRQLRVGLAEQDDGGAGGCVAGHHQGLHALLQQPVRRRHGQRPDLFQGPLSIGGVGGVAEV